MSKNIELLAFAIVLGREGVRATNDLGSRMSNVHDECNFEAQSCCCLRPTVARHFYSAALNLCQQVSMDTIGPSYSF